MSNFLPKNGQNRWYSGKILLCGHPQGMPLQVVYQLSVFSIGVIVWTGITPSIPLIRGTGFKDFQDYVSLLETENSPHRITEIFIYSKAHNYLDITDGRGYNPRQRQWEYDSLGNCQHVFGIYYKTSSNRTYRFWDGSRPKNGKRNSPLNV